MTPRPVLYTFRRCPYVMRARWAVQVSALDVELREITLRAKPAAMLVASPKGTVPVLVLPDGQVIDESLDVMRWALAQHDPEGWLAPAQGTLADMLALIEACERDFKPHLDRYKYPARYRAEWGGAPDAVTAIRWRAPLRRSISMPPRAFCRCWRCGWRVVRHRVTCSAPARRWPTSPSRRSCASSPAMTRPALHSRRRPRCRSGWARCSRGPILRP